MNACVYNTAMAYLLNSRKERVKHYQGMVKEYYDIITGPYVEVWGSEYFHPHFWPPGKTREEAIMMTHEYMLKKLNAPPDAVVADFGCGIGAFSILLAQRFKKVTALNMNRGQLAIARKKARAGRIKNIEFVEADIMETRFENAYDVIVLHDVAPHLPDRKKALKILHRALKPGGKLIMSEWLAPAEASAAAKLLLIERFSTIWAFPYMPSPEDYARWFPEAGFRVLLAENWSKRIARQMDFSYKDALEKVKKMGYLDLARMTGIRGLANFARLKEVGHAMMDSVLYSKAMLDTGLFLHYFYVVQKPLTSGSLPKLRK
jgi:ubiquinone/menaquinone biosynthesis C-methylase UbiE